jgi:hypothetical protein
MGFVMDGATIDAPGRGINDASAGVGGRAGRGFGLEAEYNSFETGDGEEEDGNYGDEDYGDNYDDDGGYDGGEDILNEEAVPLMPDEFYSDVDSFLSRPPPKFKGLKSQSKTREKLEEKIMKSTSLPVLLPPKPKKIESKVNTGLKKGQPGKRIEKQIDSNLLRQAFEYTAQLQHQHSGDDNDDDLLPPPPHHHLHSMNKKKSSSAPHISSSSSRGVALHIEEEDDDEGEEEGESHSCDRKQAKLKQAYGSKSQHQQQHQQGSRVKGKKPPNGMVKRLRSQTYTHQTASAAAATASADTNGGFDTSVSRQSDGGSNRQVLDFNALVANFEQGIALKQLQQELEDSRAAMARSKRAVEEISKEMATKMRF